MRRPDGRPGSTPRRPPRPTSGVKAMIPVGRPFLDYVLSALADAGLPASAWSSVRSTARSATTTRTARDAARGRDQLRHPGRAARHRRRGARRRDRSPAAMTSSSSTPTTTIRSRPARARPQGGAGVAGLLRRACWARGNLSAERSARFAVAEVDARRFLDAHHREARRGDAGSPGERRPGSA